jgi:hypothetical protein
MKKKLAQKIIFSLIIFTLLTPSVILPTVTQAATKLDWDNPSKNGNTYKVPLAKSLTDPKMMMSVIGCSGNLASTLILDKAKDLVTWLKQRAKEKAVIKACQVAKKSAVAGVAAAPNLSLTDIALTADCKVIQKTESATADKKLDEIKTEIKKSNTLEQCLNGIAFKLAQDQLTAMTKYTMNWVNSGFGGDPLYVRNVNSFMNNMTDDILMKEISVFQGDPTYYPYGNAYARGAIYGSRNIKNFAESMKQSLSNYLGSGTAGDTAFDISEKYTNNFGMGGWDGWLAFTQQPQNNPLGYSMKMSEYIAGKQSTETDNTKQELLQNGGYFSQKKCIAFGLTAKAAQANVAKRQAQASLANKLEIKNNMQEIQNSTCLKDMISDACKKAYADFALADSNYGKEQAAFASKYNETNGAEQGTEDKDCTKWETTTPGSAIGAKVNAYLNAPETQLQLADTINETLSALLTKLVKTMQNNGLSSLASNNTDFSSTDNPTNGYNSQIVVDPNTGEITTSSGYTNGPIDLTKDLGNTFIHETNGTTFTNLGKWDASKNYPRLFLGVGETNSYYTVSVAGDTEIINEGFNEWKVGDRAFFDGTNWQNWKCAPNAAGDCTKQINPIKTRGILQIQEDYLVAARSALSILPGIMPKIGKLDYCIPGPNPSWEINISNTSEAFTDYVTELDAKYTEPGGFLGSREYATIYSPEFSSNVFQTYLTSFDGASSTYLGKIMSTYPIKSIIRLDKIREEPTSGMVGWKGSYRQNGQKWSRVDEAGGMVEDLKTKIMNDLALFKEKYRTIINNRYGASSSMQKEYIEREDTGELKLNTDYLRMAKSGLDITKDMISYDEDITSSTEEYNQAINEANSNIYRLKQIKNEVSDIIKAAQARRNTALLAKIKETYGETLTKQQFETKYAGCLKEEDILVYEDVDKENVPKLDKTERCNDGIDNDLDGLVDAKDPDCAQQVDNSASVLNDYNSILSEVNAGQSCTPRTRVDEDGVSYEGECFQQ